jgi:hypothetical protein
MHRNRVLFCVVGLGLVSVFLTAGFAIARDNDDKKDRSNQGGRSSSNSGNGGNSGSLSSRSMSSSSDSSRSFSSRSSQSIQIPSSDRSIRTFGSGNGNDGATFSGKSFSGLSSRSSDNNSYTNRSSGSQTVARPIDGANFNGNGGTGGSPFQGFSGFSRGNTSSGNSGNSDNNSARVFGSGSKNSSPFNRFSDNSSQNDRSSDNNSRNGSESREIRIAMETRATMATLIRTLEAHVQRSKQSNRQRTVARQLQLETVKATTDLAGLKRINKQTNRMSWARVRSRPRKRSTIFYNSGVTTARLR